MTGPTPTHSDQNPVSGMGLTPNASETLTGPLSPCRCWVQSPLTGHSGHCCFGYPDPDGDRYQRGQPPPCNHWHKDVPRPTEETA